MPSRDKVILQVYVPQEVLDLVDSKKNVIAATRSKIVEYAIRNALSDGSLCVELSQEVIDLVDENQEVVALTRSKVVEYAIHHALGDLSLCVELTQEEMDLLNSLSIAERREPRQQAAVLISEALKESS